ncbi:MAG: class I SAM-dependent methyltransferase [Candidatus Thorarchaeota archaeon]
MDRSQYEKLIPSNYTIIRTIMDNYYSSKLAAENLRKCYDIAPARTRQYLAAEIDHVLKHISEDDIVLELGCGYGRVLSQIASRCSFLIGIDTSYESLKMAQSYLSEYSTIELSLMNAIDLCFPDSSFDAVICIQNGISAFKVDSYDLVREAYRVARPDGICLFSTYASKFWDSRLEWFRLQSEAGLLGEIDWNLTNDGIIVCRDGFTARTYTEHDFKVILEALGVRGQFIEVDESSLFCEIQVKDKP